MYTKTQITRAIKSQFVNYRPHIVILKLGSAKTQYTWTEIEDALFKCNYPVNHIMIIKRALT